MRVGDAVRLNSGGPVMYVINFGYWGHAVCNWLDDERRMCVALFRPVCLF